MVKASSRGKSRKKIEVVRKSIVVDAEMEKPPVVYCAHQLLPKNCGPCSEEWRRNYKIPKTKDVRKESIPPNNFDIQKFLKECAVELERLKKSLMNNQ